MSTMAAFCIHSCLPSALICFLANAVINNCLYNRRYVIRRPPQAGGRCVAGTASIAGRIARVIESPKAVNTRGIPTKSERSPALAITPPLRPSALWAARGHNVRLIMRAACWALLMRHGQQGSSVSSDCSSLPLHLSSHRHQSHASHYIKSIVTALRRRPFWPVMSFVSSLFLAIPVVLGDAALRYTAIPSQATSRCRRGDTAAMLLHRVSLTLTLLLFAAISLFTIQSMPASQARIHQTVLGLKGNATAQIDDFTPPFRTAGKHIIDADGKRFKLASINWYGASDVYFVPGGLDIVHRDELAATIRRMGFNSVRFPYSDQMVIENPIVDPKWLQANLDLLDPYLNTDLKGRGARAEASGPRAIEVYNACVKALTDAGIAVIINNHITNAHWCDGKNLCDSSWRNDQYGPICNIRQTTETWIDHWKTIMEPFIDDPLVIGADLRNEPRGVWGTMNWNLWAEAAEKAGEALLATQPNWLMFVEGVSSANDCSGAKKRPIHYSVPDRVVYSAHVYQWSGWGKLVPYGKRAYPSFALDMERNWAYLLRKNIAPVWVGEFGAPHGPREGDRHYWDNLMKYLKDVDADFGYWALNPHKGNPYDVETYGLLKQDWTTIIEDYRIRDLRSLMQAQPAELP